MEFSEKKPVKNRKTCCVYGCQSSANRNRTVRFHLFPKKGERLVSVKNKWGDKMMCDKSKAWKRALKFSSKVKSNTFVCSLHFSASDYKPARPNKEQRCLLPTAVPSCNLPITPVHGIIESLKPKPKRKRILLILSTVPNETVKDEFNTPENNINQEVNHQFEFVSCDSVSANENDVDSQNKAALNIKSENIEDFNGVKEEIIEQENFLAQDLIQHHFLLSNVEMKSSILTEEQKAEEMLEQSIPIIKDEFTEFEDSQMKILK